VAERAPSPISVAILYLLPKDQNGGTMLSRQLGGMGEGDVDIRVLSSNGSVH
jgi:hypothetical protein